MDGAESLLPPQPGAGSVVLDADVAALADEVLRSVFEVAPTAGLVLDEDRRVVLVNGRAERLLGRPREALLGRSIEDFLSLSSPTLAWSAIGEEPEELLRAHARHSDGSEAPLTLTVTPLGLAGREFLSVSARPASERSRTPEDLAHEASHDA